MQGRMNREGKQPPRLQDSPTTLSKGPLRDQSIGSPPPPPHGTNSEGPNQGRTHVIDHHRLVRDHIVRLHGERPRAASVTARLATRLGGGAHA